MNATEARTIAADTAKALVNALGERLRSVVLYGSVPRGEYVEGVSDINLLLLLDNVDTPTLAAAAAVEARMVERGVNPLVLEWRERIRAADVFGIELLDMRDAHEVLAGVEPFDGLNVPRQALRLQTERELRTRLLALHSAMLHAKENAGVPGAILIAALPAFVTYLRAVLRLAEEPIPSTMREVIRRGCDRTGADPAGLLAALDARLAARPWGIKLEDPVVEAYRAACERTADHVDALEGDGTR